MSKFENNNTIELDPKSKEFKEIMGVAYSLLEKVGEVNYGTLMTEAVRRVTHLKHPEIITTVLEPVVMAGLDKVDFGKLKEIKGLDKIKGLSKNVGTLGQYVGLLGDIGTGIKYVKAWNQMDECKNKQKANMELAIKLENAKTQKERDEIKKKLDIAENEYNDLLKKSGKNLIGAIAGVVGKMPLIGPAYAGIINGSSKLLDNAIDIISEHNRQLSRYLDMFNKEMGGSEISKEFRNLEGFSDNYKMLKSLESSGIINIMSEYQKINFQKKLNQAETEFAKAREKMEEINRELEKIGNRRRNGETPDTPFGFTPDGDFKGPNKGREGANQPYDPLVVDLKNDGFEIMGLKDGTHFDIDGDKLKEKTSWTSKSDGFLSIDLDGNGKIESGAELFGDSFLLADGTYAKSAIEALASLDKNKDGVIDAKDDVYSKLRIWNDANGNGISEAEELKSLADYNITSINVADIKDENKDINGSRLRRTISFERQEKIVEDNVEKIIKTTGKIGEFLL